MARRLQPLIAKVVELWGGFLPKQTYPNRTGVHPNTAFGLVFALDWARAAGSSEFEKLIVSRARDYYFANESAPATQEPDGTDFLSPSLEVCDLMRRILPKAEFVQWFSRYLTPAGLANVSKPPVVSDRTDYQIVHLDGLSLSRAWCLRGIANALPSGDARRDPMLPRITGTHRTNAAPHHRRRLWRRALAGFVRDLRTIRRMMARLQIFSDIPTPAPDYL